MKNALLNSYQANLMQQNNLDMSLKFIFMRFDFYSYLLILMQFSYNCSLGSRTASMSIIEVHSGQRLELESNCNCNFEISQKPIRYNLEKWLADCMVANFENCLHAMFQF